MNQLYNALPYPLKNISVSAIAAMQSKKKYGNKYRSHLEFLVSSTPTEKEHFIKEELAAFLSLVELRSNYYNITNSQVLSDMPIIEKQDVIKNSRKILLEKPFKSNKSSGSTGQPFQVFYNRSVYQHEYAYWWYHRASYGVSPGDKVATFAGHKVTFIDRQKAPFWVYNQFENQLLFSSYHMTKANLAAYVKELNKFQPVLLHGYPSSIFLIAKYILENNVTMSFFPKMIVTASESLLDFQAETIKKAFQRAPVDWYGNTELCGHATQCPEGRIHAQTTHSIFRVVDEEGHDVALGKEGTIIATNFINTCMPLINYNTKDRAVVSRSQKCTCGQRGVLLDRIIGRIEDYIYTSDGKPIGRLDHLFKHAKHVANAQIIQDAVGEITIRIERHAQFSKKMETTIKREAHNRLGKDMVVLFDYDTEISKQPNGKFSFIEQNIQSK